VTEPASLCHRAPRAHSFLNQPGDFALGDEQLHADFDASYIAFISSLAERPNADSELSRGIFDGVEDFGHAPFVNRKLAPAWIECPSLLWLNCSSMFPNGHNRGRGAWRDHPDPQC